MSGVAEMAISDRLCAQCLQRKAFHMVYRRSVVTGRVRIVHLCDACMYGKRQAEHEGIETLDKPARAVGENPDLDAIEKGLKE